MKHSIVMKYSTIGLGVVAWVAGSGVARAECNTGVPAVNMVLNDAQPDEALEAWNSWYESADPFLHEGGIAGIATAASSPLNKHILATILTHHGVKGQPPEPELVLGAWSFGPSSNPLIWHRGLDEYSQVTYGRGGAWAWNQILPDGSLVRGTSMHYGHRTRMVPGRAPWAANGWDFTFDGRPNRRIDFSCEAFSKPAAAALGMDAVGLAGVAVHEALHTSGLGHHGSPLDRCVDSPGGKVCDFFVANTRPSPKGGIVGIHGGGIVRTPISVGSNQGGAEFYCDIGAAPADWVPVMASLAAREYFENMSTMGRFINVPDLPYDCTPRDSLLRKAGFGVCTDEEDVNAPTLCRPEFGGADCLAGSGQTCAFPDGVCSNNPTLACSSDGECQHSLADLGATCDPVQDPPPCLFGVCTNGGCPDAAATCPGEGLCCEIVK